MAPSEKPIGGHEPCCVRRNFAPAHGDPAAASIDKFKKPKGSRGRAMGAIFQGEAIVNISRRIISSAVCLRRNG